MGHTPLGNGALLSAEAKIGVEHCDVTDETYTSNSEPLVDTDNETGNRYDWQALKMVAWPQDGYHKDEEPTLKTEVIQSQY